MTAGDTLPPQRQPVVLYDWTGHALAVQDGVAIPSGTPGLLFMGQDALGVARRVKVLADGSLVVSVPAIDIYVHNEVPGGSVDGFNPTFTTVYQFKTSTTHLYLNGVRQTEGPTKDYVEDIGRTSITFNSPPHVGNVLLIDYVKAL